MRYIRNDIILDFEMPEVLKNFIIEVEKADERNDGTYDEYADYLDVLCKNICAEGGLSKEQWDKVIKKYPYPY